MKKILISLIIFQLILIILGVYQILTGKTLMGLFNITVNAIFILVNIGTLKKL